MQPQSAKQIQDQFLAGLRETISSDRLAPYYQSQAATSHLDVVALYAYNAALCEALYTALQNLEVGLRNRLHAALTKKLKTAEWYKDHFNKFDEGEQKSIKAAGRTLLESGKPFKPKNMIPLLQLAFWHGLFYPFYEKDELLWNQCLEEVFPNMTNAERTRKKLLERLDVIKTLRNRVFHHEPIWNLSDLEQQHKDLLEMIGWLDPQLLLFTRMNDRFPSVCRAGYEPHYKRIEDRLNVLRSNLNSQTSR